MDFPIENGGSFHSYVKLPEGNWLNAQSPQALEDFPIKNGDFPIKNGDFPKSSHDPLALEDPL